MAVPDFRFVVHLSGDERFDDVLPDLAMSVFRYLGYAPPIVAEMVGQLNAAVASSLDGTAGPTAGWDMQFRAQAGSCVVALVVQGHEVWRITRCLP